MFYFNLDMVYNNIFTLCRTYWYS